MLFNVLIVIHILVCLGLVGVILAQTGKGGSLSSMFGGGGGEMFLGASGASKLFAKITTALAITFMVLCFTLAIMSSSQFSSSAVTNTPVPETVETPTPTAPAQPQPQPTDEQPVEEKNETPAPVEEPPSGP